MENMGNFNQIDVCPHNEFCGGCQYQGLDYEQQLRLKNAEVIGLLKAKDIRFGEYSGLEGSPCIYRYRNKMEYTFGDMVKGGEMTLGMHQKKKFMSVVTVNECQIVDEDFNKILTETLKFCKEKKYVFYNKKSHVGFLRHLIIRKGVRTGELLVNIVTSSQGAFHEREYCEILSELKLRNTIVGIINTIHDGLSDFVYCDKMNVLQGENFYSERVMGLDFNVSAFSFFQTNIDAVERLYSEAVSMIDDLKDKTVFDLYCGTGTISQVMARSAKKVIGIEIAEESVKSATDTAEKNGLKNCEFIAGDVFAVMENLRVTPDVIVLDPPRVGVHPKALEKIVQYGANQLVYISCNPKTFAENLYFMQYYGYRPDKIKAYDNFPFTKHIECVACLRKT